MIVDTCVGVTDLVISFTPNVFTGNISNATGILEEHQLMGNLVDSLPAASILLPSQPNQPLWWQSNETNNRFNLLKVVFASTLNGMTLDPICMEVKVN